jgi:hypothetical protein
VQLACEGPLSPQRRREGGHADRTSPGNQLPVWQGDPKNAKPNVGWDFADRHWRFDHGPREASFEKKALTESPAGMGRRRDVPRDGGRRIGNGSCAGGEGIVATHASRDHPRRGRTLRHQPVEILRLRSGRRHRSPARREVCPEVRRPRLRRRRPRMRPMRRRVRCGPVRRPLRRRMRSGPPLRMRHWYRLCPLHVQLLPVVGRLPALLSSSVSDRVDRRGSPWVDRTGRAAFACGPAHVMRLRRPIR